MNANGPLLRIVTKTIFPISDMSEAGAFYRGLGFDVEEFDEAYALVLHNDEEILHLWSAPQLDVASNEAAGYFHVEDADFWHALWSNADIPLRVIEDRPWGMREFSFTDPSGNLIRVGHNI